MVGKSGDKITASVIKKRLLDEAESDVSLKVSDSPGCVANLKGRGDLHLAILIEKMRREGFELSITPPEIITKIEKGVKLEPIERV